MKKIALISSLLFSIGLSFAIENDPYPTFPESRAPGEDFETVVSNFKENLQLSDPMPHTLADDAVPIDKMNFKDVPILRSMDELNKMFKEARDTRNLEDLHDPGFKRRLSWLNPQDGCFARAAVVAKQEEDMHHIRGYKILIFGNLEANTPFDAKGYVNWNYHIAVVLGVKGKGYFVIDPALDASKPLPVKEWVALSNVKNDQNIKGIICPYAYTPGHPCDESKDWSDEWGIKEMTDETYIFGTNFLTNEKTNLIAMGYDPQKELGDRPYWKR